MSYHDDNSFSDEERALLKRYQQGSNEMPTNDVDKVIFAAMHRELQREQKIPQKNTQNLRFWQRLRLPVSMLGAAVMTFTLAHVMWPMIYPNSADSVKLNDAARNGADIALDKSQEATAVELSNVNELRQKQSKTALSSAKRAQVDREEVFYEIPQENEADNSPASVQLNANEERDRWAERILNLAKNGQFNEMNRELKKFVEAYPDYPIDEQLQPLLK